ncbi:MAG: DUF72 domain-containing protein [Flavobacteriales bacterium]|nr:MAG: DUF72 domain-containing protein [Flavobacteriales bacterium]
MRGQATKLYIGISGLLLPVPNKQYYPPAYQDKSRLTYYASLQNSIEINSSFYKIPQAKTIRKWASEVPEDFRFTFKVFRGISHAKHLAYEPETIARFMDAVNAVGDKKGSLLLQFPPSIHAGYKVGIDQLLAQFRTLDPLKSWDFSVEFRNRSLYEPEVYELLENYGMNMVIHDKAKVASPIVNINEKFAYLRLHGPDGNYKGSYSMDELIIYAEMINDWLFAGQKVYVYFNNTMGDVYANLKMLKELMG